jgi:hypothetical protein
MSYIDAGFDAFLSRSIDNLSQANLDAQGPQSTAFRYDSAQVSGFLGDTLQVGNIFIDGKSKQIIVSDGTTNRIVLGQLRDGTQGFAISKEGQDVLQVA